MGVRANRERQEALMASREGDDIMKRIVLLLSILFIFSAFCTSSVLASPLSFYYRLDRVQGIIPFYFIRLIEVFEYRLMDPPVINPDGREIVGGDADDLADGKVAPGDSKRKTMTLESGSVFRSPIGKEPAETVYRL